VAIGILMVRGAQRDEAFAGLRSASQHLNIKLPGDHGHGGTDRSTTGYGTVSAGARSRARHLGIA
jgi:hypothetical protein